MSFAGGSSKVSYNKYMNVLWRANLRISAGSIDVNRQGQDGFGSTALMKAACCNLESAKQYVVFTIEVAYLLQ